MKRKEFKCPNCHSRLRLHDGGKRWSCVERLACAASGPVLFGRFAIRERIFSRPDILRERQQASMVGRSSRIRSGGRDSSFVADKAFRDRLERTRLGEQARRIARAERRAGG